MTLSGKNIGFAVTGSFCTISEAIIELERLAFLGVEVYPILSTAVATTNTRFGRADDFRRRIEMVTGKDCIDTITDAEPIGPKKMLDLIVVAPCTGNTLSKIANGITDTPVTMAVKASLRNQKPVVLAIATNDGLGANGKNIGTLLNTKNVFFVPFGQDDPEKKNNSLIARFGLIVPTIELALEGKQIQPVLV
ncbi:MAG: dipicolinate synthase subunit B [Clostridiaceae bacterium]|jgi:dipicolinate synthase subunit B|nr:dipicolinate synthase subunit B [Bacillota bacterium]NLI37749.1 dipicolinate synthase subunit B [Clostridiaceae bacterium]